MQIKENMKISDVVAVLEGEIVCCKDKLDHTIGDFVASDLLSDILAFESHNYVLLTGLTNSHVLRTAEITSACCVVILRDKQPQPSMVSLAKLSNIPLVLSKCGMFEACCRVCRFLDKAEPPHD